MTEQHKVRYAYGCWAGNERGTLGDSMKCAETVYPIPHKEGGWIADYQCSRKNGHGPNKAYCKQHARRWQDG